MSCQNCKSKRILSVSGKTSDRCGGRINNHNFDGYVPQDMGVGGGDYLRFNVCLDCGQMQGQWPLPKSELEEEIELIKSDPFRPGDYVEWIDEYDRSTFVGAVTSYDREFEEVAIDIEGKWNFIRNKIDRQTHFSTTKKHKDEIKHTDKEW